MGPKGHTNVQILAEIGLNQKNPKNCFLYAADFCIIIVIIIIIINIIINIY